MSGSSPTFDDYRQQLAGLPASQHRIDVANEFAWKLCRIDPKEALQVAQEASDNAQEINYRKGYAYALRTLGQARWLVSDHLSTLEKCLEAIPLFRELGEQTGEADAINILGAVYSSQGDPETALTYFNQCLTIREQIGDAEGIVKSLNSIGDLHMKSGNYEAARDHFSRCLTFDHHNATMRGIVLYNMGEVSYRLGRHDVSLGYLTDCRTMGQELNFKLMEVYSLWLLGKISADKGAFKAALDQLQLALEYAREVDARERIYLILESLAEVYKQVGDIEKAFEYYQEFHQVRESVYSADSAEKIKRLQFSHQTRAIEQEKEIYRLRNVELKQAYSEIELQRNEIAAINKDLTDSINYAERIQKAMLPDLKEFGNKLCDAFVFFKPRDVVSGDFFSLEDCDNRLFIAAVDCTGHGVPGALMSMIGHNLLTQLIQVQGLTDPGSILTALNQQIKRALRQSGGADDTSDGMDLSLVCWQPQTRELEFAGAFNPLTVVGRTGVRLVAADRWPVGGHTPADFAYSTKKVALAQDDAVYLATDGYSDQFGGEHDKKFMRKRFHELLQTIWALPMSTQKEQLERSFSEWRGSLQQVDDVLVIGIKF